MDNFSYALFETFSSCSLTKSSLSIALLSLFYRITDETFADSVTVFAIGAGSSLFLFDYLEDDF